MTKDKDRQSFLGAKSKKIFSSSVIGIVGLGGGGSHIVQQLAHIGFKKYVIVDYDIVEDSNLNRLVGATRQDFRDVLQKTQIAARLIYSLREDASVTQLNAKWQEVSDELYECDIIIGALDSVSAKAELEQFCRRFHIPYFDIGMDVHELDTDRYLIAGQVVRSVYGGPCLRCLGIVTDKLLEAEAANYGDAGGQPQVIWPNGILASATIGMVIHMLTPWSSDGQPHSCLEYDGNHNTLVPSRKLRVLANKKCAHFPDNEAGDPFFDIRSLRKNTTEQHDATLESLRVYARALATVKNWVLGIWKFK